MCAHDTSHQTRLAEARAGAVPARKKAPRPKPGNFARRTRQKTSALHQLRICKLSGEVVARTDAHRHQTLLSLLTSLEPTCGVSKHRIRLLQDGHVLQRDVNLQPSAPLDLQLVLLPYMQTNNEIARSFREALHDQDTVKLESLLWQPVDPNTTFSRYLPRPITALELALLNPGPLTKTMLSTLLDAKAAPDRPENQGLLCMALEREEEACVQLLLRHRADPNRSSNRITPIDIACQRCHAAMSFQYQEPRTAVMLLSAGADAQPMLRDANSWTMQPTPKDYLDYMHPRTLASTVSLVRAATTLSTPAVMRQILEAAKCANVCIMPACLCSAAHKGNEDAVRWLLGARAAVDSHICHLVLSGAHNLLFSNHARRTALALAASRGHHATLNVLLEARADPNKRLDGQTALLQAAAHEAPEAVVRSILKAAAEVNQEDSSGRTALRLAFLSRKAPDVGVVQALLRAKADKQHRDHFGKTIFSIAAQRLDNAILSLMMQDH